ncbi:GNAT family N-acetyltransferase [Aeromonas veronii]|uniref:GNAT family N-acetyltransferase n=1 Tax=Aeromonas veronii TaxID=654 RepID=UPI002A69AB98|nr:GNAT family N-acetyltransferase [Aeromonas veronii]
MDISLLADHPHHVSKIVEWYFDEWASHVPGVTNEMVRKKVEVAALNRDIPFSLVAYDDRELVGTLELKIQENKNHPEYEFWIGGIYVPAVYRRKGIAKKCSMSPRIWLFPVVLRHSTCSVKHITWISIVSKASTQYINQPTVTGKQPSWYGTWLYKNG